METKEPRSPTSSNYGELIAETGGAKVRVGFAGKHKWKSPLVIAKEKLYFQKVFNELTLEEKTKLARANLTLAKVKSPEILTETVRELRPELPRKIYECLELSQSYPKWFNKLLEAEVGIEEESKAVLVEDWELKDIERRPKNVTVKAGQGFNDAVTRREVKPGDIIIETTPMSDDVSIWKYSTDKKGQPQPMDD